MMRYSRKLFLQRLIGNLLLDGNRRGRLKAYGGFEPCNRIHNNILQISRHPEARHMGQDEVNQLVFLSRKLLEYAGTVVEFRELDASCTSGTE